MKKADVIFTSDWHIRENTPEARVDDFMKSQSLKFQWLCDLQKKHNAFVICSGDIFHHWKPSPFLMSWALSHIPDKTIVIPGQHDLPAHNLENIDKSGIYVLAKAKKIELLIDNNIHEYSTFQCVGFPWGSDLHPIQEQEKPTIAIVHKLTYKKHKPFPGAEEKGGDGISLVKQLKNFSTICVGDNHQTFVERVGKQLLVNPGSLMRTTAAQVDHKPCVFLWRASDNEIEQVFLPIDKNAVSRDHIDLENEKDERIESFVSRLKDNVEITLSFRSNLDRYMTKNKVRNGVQKIIKECLP